MEELNLKIGEKVIICYSFNRYEVGIVEGITKAGSFKVEKCINYPKTEEVNTKHTLIFYKNGFQRGGGNFHHARIKPFEQKYYYEVIEFPQILSYIKGYNYYILASKEGGIEIIKQIYDLIKE
jgi:hypothetical protein